MDNKNQPVSLVAALAQYRFAYLMTATPGGAPHAVAVKPWLEHGVLVVDGLGKRSRTNASVQSNVGLIWPPQIESDYSLVVDGQARLIAGSLWITPTRAVLHRPGPTPSRQPAASEACTSDCIELDLAPTQAEQ